MPVTVVDLCNMALAHLRQRPVTGDGADITGDTIEAVSCRRFYETAMREAFRAFDWSFARQYFAGQKIANAGVPNWKYAYEVPGNVEVVRYVAQNDRTEAPVRFRLMRTSVGGANRPAVFTNEDAAWLVCTVYIADPASYPADFLDFAAFTLAAHLAMPITGKADLMMGMRKIAEEAGKRAAMTATSSETEDQGESPPRATPLPASSQVDIANSALSMLGQPAIVTFADRTREADTVRRFFRQAVDMSLRLYDWPFARVVVTGQKVSAAPVPNWQFAYALPVCAALRYIMRSSDDEQPVRYQILRAAGAGGDRLVYTNEDNARFVVTGLVEDPAQWPQDFVQLVAANLAQLMALSLTGKADVLKAMSEAAEMAGKLAITAATQEEGEQDGADASRDVLPTNSVPIEVANLALGLIGQEAIQAFGERTKRANAARRFYALALRATLRSVDWPFARTYVQATPADGPAVMTGWRYAYQYPANCAAVRGFAKRYPTDYDARYQVAGGFILCNKPLQTLIYTRWDVDPAAYDPEFTDLLAHELAARIAVPLTGKNEAATYLRQVAKGLRDKARADAANESPEELDERVPEWLAVRGVPSLTREDRERWHGGAYGWDRLGGPWGSLPGSGGVNPTPPMISGPGPGSSILPAYIPGLTAPVEPTPQLLSSSDFWVESTGGRIERDGTLVVDDPSEYYVEPEYDIQEDN